MQDVRLLLMTPEPRAMAPALRLRRIVVKAIALIAVPICVAGLIAAGIGFAQVWRTGDWQHLWDALSHSARFAWLVVLVPYLSGWLALPQMRDALPALERVAMRGDARLAPLAARQPEPSAEPESGPTTFEALRGARDDLAATHEVARWELHGLALVAALLAVELTVAVVLLGIATRESAGSWVIQAALAVVPLAVLALATATIVSLARLARRSHQIAQRLRAGPRIQAYGAGLRWVDAESAREQTLPWGEARAFYVITAPADRPWASFMQRFRRKAPGPRETVSLYALVSEHARLMWVAPTSREPHARSEHEQLCRLIATHTGLPLRDLSTASVSLAHAVRAVMNGQAIPTEAQATLRELSVPPRALPLERVRRKTRRLSYLALALLAPYLVIVLVGIAGSVLQHMRVG